MTFDIVPFFGFVPVLVFIVAVILISIFINKVKPQIKDDAKKDEEQNKSGEPNIKPFASKKMSEEDVKKAKTVGKILIIIGLSGLVVLLVGMIICITNSGQVVDLFFFAPIVVVFLILGLILINAKTINEKTSSAIDKIQKTNNNEKEKPVYRCDYCGARLEDCDKRCPGCGARRKVKKD